MYLSVIIPAYNEEKRIEATLESVDTYLRRQNYKYEIIVVNDGSTDRTEEVVLAMAKHIPNLRVVNNYEHHGKGWVVRMGMLSAKGLFRLFMDADNSTNISTLDQFFPYIRDGYDIVISSRRLKDSMIEVHQNWIRDALGGIFRLIVRLIVPVGVTDTQNGFKLFTAHAAEETFRRQRTFTWAFDVEILAIARRLQFKVKEAPVHWVNDGRSHVTFAGMIRMLIEVFEIRLNLWSGVYVKKVGGEIVTG